MCSVLFLMRRTGDIDPGDGRDRGNDPHKNSKQAAKTKYGQCNNNSDIHDYLLVHFLIQNAFSLHSACIQFVFSLLPVCRLQPQQALLPVLLQELHFPLHLPPLRALPPPELLKLPPPLQAPSPQALPPVL